MRRTATISEGEGEESGPPTVVTGGRCEFLEGLLAGTIPQEIESFNEQTQRRAASARLFMAQLFKDLAMYRFKRQMRAAELEDEIIQRGLDPPSARALREEHLRNESAYLRLKRVKTKINDFQLLSLLGRGGYGEVYLAREIRTARVVALKRMAKSHYSMKNARNIEATTSQVCCPSPTVQRTSVAAAAATAAPSATAAPQTSRATQQLHRERQVLASSQSPWIIRLYCCFQDQEYLYFAMEFAPGGDLRWLLNNLGRLDEPAAAFYFAEMLLAVEYLHKLGYVHRDLKPSNFVIDTIGHLKLIDFGLSMDGLQERITGSDTSSMMARSRAFSASCGNLARIQQVEKTEREMKARARRSYAIVGSPDYMCPEMLEGTGYDHRGDLWSLGCILYEMCAGFGPFMGTSAEQVFSNVLNWQEMLREKPLLPESERPISDSAWSLIKSILCEATRRASIATIRSHQWFAESGVNDWTKLRDHETPFTPVLDSECDTSYFGDAASTPAEAAAAASAAASPGDRNKEIADTVKAGTVPTGFFNQFYDDENLFVGFTFRAYPTLKHQ